LTSDANHTAKEWDAVTWKEIRRFQLDPTVDLNTVRAEAVQFAVCAEAGLVATVNSQGSFELFAISAPEERRHFKGQEHTSGMAFSQNGKTLAAASEYGTVELWDTATARRAALLHGVLFGFHSVAVSANSERLAAGSNGREAIKLWDLDSHEEVATLAGHGSFFADATFSPDGNTIAARNWMGVIHFWNAPSWAEIQIAERALQAADSP
jgi:WD40 repeat protein